MENQTPTLSADIWKPISKTHFDERLAILPPLLQEDGKSFLLKEEVDYRVCAVKNIELPTFDGFTQQGKKYFATKTPVTQSEFKKLLKEFPPKVETPKPAEPEIE